MKRHRKKPNREPTIALINIVFLMLVFFMVAGTLAAPLDDGLTLVETRDLDTSAPPDALVIGEDGRLSYRGEAVGAISAGILSEGSARIVPDRNVPATRLLEVAEELRAIGAENILIVTERALQ